MEEGSSTKVGGEDSCALVTLGSTDTLLEDDSFPPLPKSLDTNQVIDNLPSRGVNSTKSQPWVELIKGHSKTENGAKLQHIDGVGGKAYLKSEYLGTVEKRWGFGVAGVFTPRHPGRQALMDLCKTWQVPFKYIPDVNGWMVFRFDKEGDRDRVLNGGPYSVYGRHLLLKPIGDWFSFGRPIVPPL